jgi:hypothetical protein
MKELSIETMERLEGGSMMDCVGVGASIVGAVFLTYTTGPLWAVAGGWSVWVATTAAAVYGCGNTLGSR